jgi:hypothetical protein
MKKCPSSATKRNTGSLEVLSDETTWHQPDYDIYVQFWKDMFLEEHSGGITRCDSKLYVL